MSENLVSETISIGYYLSFANAIHKCDNELLMLLRRN